MSESGSQFTSTVRVVWRACHPTHPGHPGSEALRSSTPAVARPARSASGPAAAAQLRATAHVMDLLLEDIGKMDLTLGRVGLGFRASGRRVGVALRGHV